MGGGGSFGGGTLDSHDKNQDSCFQYHLTLPHIVRMKKKIESTIASLNEISTDIETAYHAGVIDGFDTKCFAQISSA